MSNTAGYNPRPEVAPRTTKSLVALLTAGRLESTQASETGINSPYVSVLCGFLLVIACGCGGNSSSPGGGLGPDFSISLAPTGIALAQGTSQNVSVQVSPIDSFTGDVQITVSGLPAGVSAAPLSIAVTTGANSGTLQLSATNSAVITNTSATVHAISGSLQHTAPLALGPSFNSAAYPFATLGGGVLRGYYDAQRELLFASNFFLNEVDVVSATNFTVLKRVSIPQPVGLDQMPDGKTIIAGTMTQGIYLINEDNFAVQANFVATPPPPNSAFNILPIIPASMANGKVLFICLRQGVDADYYLGGEIYEWDPTGNTFAPAPIAVGPTGPAETEHLARSGDHKFAIFNQFGGGVYIYSSDADAFNNINNGFYAGDVVANQDGSQFAESVNGWVNFYDRNLNLLGSVTPAPRDGNAELMPDYGMQYSPDGSTVYVQATDQRLSPIIVIDAMQLAEVGTIPKYFGLSINPAYLLAAGNTKNAYIAAVGGVGSVDCSHPTSSLSIYQVLPLTSEPDSAPLNASATVNFEATNLPVGTAVTIGGASGTLQANSGVPAAVTVPGSSIPGPADVVFSMPDRTAYVFPQDFSYGITASALSSTLAPDGVAVPLTLYGFGLVPQNRAPTVSFGGMQASAINIAGYGVTENSLEAIQVTTPVASAGTVDVVVNNENGTAAMKSALTYLHTTVIPSAPGLSSLLFDTHRNLLYATRTNGTQIFVLDPGTLQWKAPLPVPGALPSATYNYIALTPDGAKLVAVDSTNAVVTVFNPDNPSAGQSLSLRNANVANGPPVIDLPFLMANYVAATSTGKVFVNVVGWYPAEIDLNTMTFEFRPEAGPDPAGCAIFRTSIDGSHFVDGCGGGSEAGVSVWDPSTDTFLRAGFQQSAGSNDFAITNDGKTIAAISIDQLAPDDVTFFLDSELHLVNSPAYPDLAPPDSRAAFGVHFSPHGTVFVLPRLDSIDFVDVGTGKLRARYATPEPIVTPQNVADERDVLAIDPAGQTIFAISASGLTVIKFPDSIDSLAQPAWPYSRTANKSPRPGNAVRQSNMNK